MTPPAAAATSSSSPTAPCGELEQRLLLRLFALDKRQFAKVGLASGISPKSFFGIDVNENAVETAKVTLMLARRLGHRAAEKFWADHADELPGQDTHSLEFERDLPLDNLDANILCADALFTPWPEVEAIIGNPPFLDARRVTMIHGAEYSERVRAAFPDVPGRADFCVHWFRKAHEVLKPGCRAGLVGTNTIRQNYSREGGLDYIVANGGVIAEAVSTQVWSGESAVHVSIVNWVKPPKLQPGQGRAEFWLPVRRRLFTQRGDAKDGEWRCEELDTIGPALSAGTDVTAALPLKANQHPKPCFEGQQPGHDGFRLESQARQQMVLKDKNTAEVTFPYLNGDELLSGSALRFIIDFGNRAMDQAARYGLAFNHLKREVLPKWQANAKAEREKTGRESGEHQNRLKTWWLLKRPRDQMLSAILPLPRYIACARVTKRPIFEFLSSSIRPDSSLTVFAFADDYSFGILQSGIHWAWFKARCSTLKGDFRYTSDTVFDAFPWPQFAPEPPSPHAAIPKGLNHSAQGCASSATLGNARQTPANSERVASPPAPPSPTNASAPAPHSALRLPHSALEKVRAVAEAARSLRALRREIMQCQRLVPARPLSHPRNPRRQPPPRRPHRPRLRRPRRLRHEGTGRPPRLPSAPQFGTGGQGSERPAHHTAGPGRSR